MYSAFYLTDGRVSWETPRGAGKTVVVILVLSLVVQVLDVRRREPRGGCRGRQRYPLSNDGGFRKAMLGIVENRCMQYATRWSTLAVCSGAGSTSKKN